MKTPNLWIASFALLIAACAADSETPPAEEPAGTEPSTEPAAHGHHARPPLPSAAEIAQLPADGGEHWNRLVFEKSPYLLQHAANPVDWYPWGDEAFEQAAAENKPIFLSIGYSTCHWCHVMERESFEDDEVGAYLKEHYISIKVDREERPDVDQFYMAATQAMTGRGGWPMTVIMTADKKPFFTGTYFPKEGDGRRGGLMDILREVVKVWDEDPERIFSTADAVIERLQQTAQTSPGELLGEAELKQAYERFSKTYDEVHGGFGAAPKFPVPHNLRFLLQYAHRSGDDGGTKMVTHTLDRMRLGGMWDHLGYGFHRYSTDRLWLLPHFEKMLYDQALLAMAYAEAFQVTRLPRMRQTTEEIFTYVLRDMRDPEGGFYSAEDADTEGEEGLFYLWRPEEVIAALGAEEGELFNRIYNIVDGGNFHDQATGEKTGESIVYLKQSIEEIAARDSTDAGELSERLARSRAKLFEARKPRVRPLKDTKILTDWNGLMIAALAKAGQILEQPSYVIAAKQAADFVLANVRTPEGQLLKRYRDGEAGLPATLEDYAFFSWGLLELYEATFDVGYLQHARELTQIMLRDFWDPEQDGFFMTSSEEKHLPFRSKEIYDGALPSGNSAAASVMQRIGRILADSTLEQRAEEVMRAFAQQVRRAPTGHAHLLMAADFAVGPSYEVVIAGRPGEPDTEAMLHALRGVYVPNKVVLLRPEGASEAAITRLAEFTETQVSLDGKATAYVCQNYACKQPTTDIEVMLESLKP